jgi:hypothetical protein
VGKLYSLSLWRSTHNSTHFPTDRTDLRLRLLTDNSALCLYRLKISSKVLIQLGKDWHPMLGHSIPPPAPRPKRPYEPWQAASIPWPPHQGPEYTSRCPPTVEAECLLTTHPGHCPLVHHHQCHFPSTTFVFIVKIPVGEHPTHAHTRTRLKCSQDAYTRSNWASSAS